MIRMTKYAHRKIYEHAPNRMYVSSTRVLELLRKQLPFQVTCHKTGLDITQAVTVDAIMHKGRDSDVLMRRIIGEYLKGVSDAA